MNTHRYILVNLKTFCIYIQNMFEKNPNKFVKLGFAKEV